MKFVPLYCVIFMAATTLFSHPNKQQLTLADSLLTFSQQDTLYVRTLQRLANSYLPDNQLKADSLFRIALQVATKIEDTKGQLETALSLCFIQKLVGNHPAAYELASQVINLAEQYQQPKYARKAYGLRGFIMMGEGFFEQALADIQTSLSLAEQKKDSFGIATALHNMAGVYSKMDSLDKTLDLLQQVYQIRRFQDEKYLLSTTTDIAYALNQQGKSKEALSHILKVRAELEQKGDSSSVLFINSHETLANIYIKLGQLDNAENVCLKILPIAESTGVIGLVLEFKKHLATIYQQKNHFQKAYAYTSDYWELRDSISGAASKANITHLLSNFETTKKEKEILHLQQQNAHFQHLQNLFAAGAIIALLFAVLVVAFFRYRQRKNQELLAAKTLQAQQLESVNQMKSAFLTNISHEFRTPLTLILGPTQELLETASTDTDRKQLTWIRQNSHRLLKLINQLLDLSKVEANKMGLKCSHQDVIQFSKYVFSAFESLGHQKKIQLKFQSDCKELFLYFDHEKLETILHNLLSNALKFTNTGFVRLSIGKTENGFAKFEVTDTGTGIHEQQLPYVFDRFFQAQQADQIAFTGTGIGLALCKELTELHSGSIRVKSDLGKGTTFTVLLPLDKNHLKPSQISMKPYLPFKAPADIKTIPSESMPLITTKTADLPLLLLVDDNPDMLAYVQQSLSTTYRYLQAKDGVEAWKLAQQEIPDLVVSDVMMPNKNGFELCAQLKQDPRTDHIPIILLTARIGEDYKIKGLSIQADAYLQKPFNKKEFRATIQNLLNSRQKLRKRFAQQVVFQTEAITKNPKETAFIERLTAILEQHLDSLQLDVVLLAQKMNMSKAQLNRKMKAILSKSPNQYIRSFRLEKARQLIYSKVDLTLSQIAYEVGFSSLAYFSKCYKDEFGHSPGATSGMG